MTFPREQIIAWARQAELHCHVKLTEHGLIIEDLQYFAAIIEQAARADEREAVEERVVDLFAEMETPYLPDIVAAIRALKEQA